MLGDTSGQSSDLPAILQFQRDKVAWDTASTIFSSKENVWPGLNLETMKGDTAVAGPTGVPWVNSNGWFSLLAGELAPGKNPVAGLRSSGLFEVSFTLPTMLGHRRQPGVWKPVDYLLGR